MRNKLLIFIFALFMISFISAVNIVPSTFSVSQQVGEKQNYNIEINNTNNFTILDFNFGNLTDLGFIFGNTTIEKNTLKSVSVNITPNQDLNEIINQRVQYSFYVNIPTEVTNYIIEVDENGFSPKYTALRVGDTIEFKNIDTIVHNAKSTLFDQNIQPNSSFIYTFQGVGEVEYEDYGWSEYIDFHGYISIISRTAQEKVHNPDLDFIWNLDLNFYPNPTTLEFELIDSEITSSVLKETEGLIKLVTTGDQEARGLKLTSNSSWITFDKDNFNLAVGSQVYVTFKSYPIITNTNQSNQTYQIEITLDGLNIGNQTKTINLFVPFKELTGNLENDFDYALWLENVWCPGHPCSAQCSPELPQCSIDSGIGSSLNQSIVFNGTVGDLTDIKRTLASLETESTRGANSINSIDDFLNTYFPGLNKTLVDAYIQSKETEKKRQTSSVTYWIIGFFLFLFSLAGILVVKNKKVSNKESWTDGRFEYRK